MRTLVALVLVASAAWCGEIDTLRKEVEALEPREHVWRAVKWKTCLLDGLRASRSAEKPILLWMFIHNPSVERC